MASAPPASFTTTTFAGDDAVDTFGWDVVYVIKASIINSSLADYFSDGKLNAVLAFDETLPPMDGLPAFAMKGQFGPWQVTTGGSGNLINLTIPIVSGTVGIVGEPNFATDMSGGSVNVQVTLGYHPVPNNITPGSVSAQLKIVTSGNAPAAGSAADIASAANASNANTTTNGLPNTVSVLSVTVPGLGPESIIASSIRSLTEQWMQNNLGVFDYVFLTADVAETAANFEWSWIKPTYVGYAYTDVLEADGTVDINNSVFAVMSMTEGRLPTSTNGDQSVATVSSQVSANAIPSNSGVNAALLLDQSRVVEKIIYPNIAGLFEGADQSDFDWSGTTVSNVNALTLKLLLEPQFYPFHPNPCTATIPAAALSVSFNSTNVQQMFSNITFPYGFQQEIDVTISLTSTSTIGVDETGQLAMQYDSDTISTLSAQPDPSQAALESLEGLGVNLVMTALCCIDGLGPAPAEVTSGTNVGAPAAVDPISGVNPVGDEPNSSDIGESGADGEVNANNLTSEQSALASELESAVSDGEGANGSIDLPRPAQNEISARDLTNPLGVSGRTEMQSPAEWSFSRFVPRFTFKVWAMFVGMIAGDLYSDMSDIDLITAYAQDPSKMPTLHNFLEGCINDAYWTNTGDQQLVCAGLNGPLIMGFTIATQSTTNAG